MKGQKFLPTPFNARCRDGGVCANLSKERKIKKTFSWRDQGLRNNLDCIRFYDEMLSKLRLRESSADVHVNCPSLVLTFNQNLSVQTNFNKFPTSNVRKEIPVVRDFFFLITDWKTDTEIITGLPQGWDNVYECEMRLCLSTVPWKCICSPTARAHSTRGWQSIWTVGNKTNRVTYAE